MTNRICRLLLVGLLLCAFGTVEGGEPERLISRYLAEVEADSTSIDAWTKLSDAYLWLARDRGDPTHVSDAESAVFEALRIDTTDTAALNQYSHVLVAQNLRPCVLLVQHRSIAEDPDNAESWGILGDALMDLGKYRAADSCYHVMSDRDRGFHSLVRIARWEFEMGDFDEAVGHMNDAIDAARSSSTSMAEDDPIDRRDLSRACVQLGRMYLSRGRLGLAAEAASASLAILPGSIPGRCLQAEIFRFERKFGASRRIYRGLIEESEDPGLTSAISRVYADQRMHHRAEPLVRQAAEEFKALYDAFPKIVRRDYAEFLLEWNLELDTARTLAYAESRERRDVYTYDLLAWAYFKNGEYDLAWSSIGLALRQGTIHPKILYHAAVIAGAAGKRDKYELYLEKARGLNPLSKRMYHPY